MSIEKILDTGTEIYGSTYTHSLMEKLENDLGLTEGEFNFLEPVDESIKSKTKDAGFCAIEIYNQDSIKKFYQWLYKDATIKLERKYLAMHYAIEKGEAYDKYREYSHN